MERPGPSVEQTIFDTSSLVFLDLLGYVPLLRQLYQVVLPEAVSEELSARPGTLGSEVVSLEWVEGRTPGTEGVRRVRQEPPKVGRGETEVVALGMELSCPVVLDDRKARLRARRAGLEITGTLGVLLRLHRLGLASRDLKEDQRAKLAGTGRGHLSIVCCDRQVVGDQTVLCRQDAHVRHPRLPFAQEPAQHTEGWSIVALDGREKIFVGTLATRARQYEQAASGWLRLRHYSLPGSGVKLGLPTSPL